MHPPTDEPASVLLARIKAEREKDASAASDGRRVGRIKGKRTTKARA